MTRTQDSAPTHSVPAVEPSRAKRRWQSDQVLHWTANSVGLLALCAVAAALLTGCGKSEEGGAAAAGGGMPPAPVGVVVAKPQSVPITTELPGRLEALRTSEVRARVAGILQKRTFVEGSDVKAGQLLFQIDPATYQATLDSAQATLARAEANLAQATALVQRYEPLQAAKAISPQEFLNAQVAQRAAQADVAAGKAAVQTARINLGYAAVTAPISGRIGRALVTEGALVGQGEATQLAVIQQINPLYVNFTQSASEVLQLRRSLAEGALKNAGQAAAKVQVVLDDGSVYPHSGRLLFSDLSVDATSGQVLLRAELPNPQGLLLPGMYVRVQLQQAEREAAFVVPQQAITRTSQGDIITLVGADGMLEKRPVKVAGAQGTNWIVVDGLKEGEQIMVDGFQKVMNPKAPVKAVPWQPEGAASAAPAASAPASAASR